MVLTELADLLDEHIAVEEAEVFLVIRAPGSAGDMARCERLFQCTPEERVELLAAVPAPLRLLLWLGEGRCTRRRDLVRGG